MPTAPKPSPMTPAQRVAASRRRAIEAGAQRLPNSLLPPDAASVLRELQALGEVHVGMCSCWEFVEL